VNLAGGVLPFLPFESQVEQAYGSAVVTTYVITYR
jgi:hypothetical protein